MTLDQMHQRLDRLSEAIAIFGGLVLTSIILLVVYAVIATKVGFPLLGDTEIIELAAAVAVFSFMPYCQMQRGHVAVTAFTSWLPASLRHRLDVLAHALMTFAIGVLCWRLFVGGMDALDRGRMSMFLQIPIWWAYAVIAPPVLLWVVTSAFIALRSLRHETQLNSMTENLD